MTKKQLLKAAIDAEKLIFITVGAKQECDYCQDILDSIEKCSCYDEDESEYPGFFNPNQYEQ